MELTTLAGILGHANVSTTTRFYLHTREDTMRRTTTALGRIRPARP